MNKDETNQEQQLESVQQEPDKAQDGGKLARQESKPQRPKRWSAQKKQELVLRLFRGETLDALSRETGLPASRIAGWRDASLAAMESTLESSSHRKQDDLAQDKRELQRKLGEVTMDNELLQEKIRKLEEQHPFPWRRSKR